MKIINTGDHTREDRSRSSKTAPDVTIVAEEEHHWKWKVRNGLTSDHRPITIEWEKEREEKKNKENVKKQNYRKAEWNKYGETIEKEIREAKEKREKIGA